MRLAARFGLALLGGVLAACGNGGSGGPGPGPGDGDGTPTPRGTPIGPPATATIGPAGGTLTSPDGQVTVSVPPGAVPSDTTFSLEPITSPGGGSGPAVRLTAGGQPLSQPVTLTFLYDDADIGEADAQGLGIAVQDAGGVWRALLASTVDGSAKAVSVGVSQLTAPVGIGSLASARALPAGSAGSDYLRAQFWKFYPRSATIDVNRELVLTVEACVREDPPAEQDPSLDWLRGLAVCRPSIRTGRWSVNEIPGGSASLGKVVTSTTSASALYTAPAAPPSPSTVSVIADMVWEARGVTKRFTSRVTIGGSVFHVLGELSRTAEPIGYVIVADVTDRVEFDVELAGGYVDVPFGWMNTASTHTGDRFPPEVTQFCSFTVDSPYEFGTFDTFASAYRPGLRVGVSFMGNYRTADTSYYMTVEGVCTLVLPTPGQTGRTLDSYFEFDPTEFPSVGDEHYAYGVDPSGVENGWVLTVERTR